MKLTFETLSVMAAVVRAGSINQAATALQRAPSTVWYAVKKAERDLGFRLMERRGRNVVLTAAGRELLSRGGAVLDLMGDLEEETELNALNAIWEGDQRSRNFNSRAAESRFKGKSAQRAGFLRAGNTLLSGAGNLMDKYG